MKNFLVLKGNCIPVDGVPEVITVLPLGHVISSKGEFEANEESFRTIQDGITKRGVDVVIDYEHQTLGGGEAPAAGWVKELKLEGGCIKAVVEWTPRGAEYLKTGNTATFPQRFTFGNRIIRSQTCTRWR